MRFRLSSAALVLSALLSAQERHGQYDTLWNDPEIQQRIDAGIRQNRMAYATLRFEGADGRPMTAVNVSFRQTRHDFLFGANIFLLGGFPTAEENSRYEAVFTNLFNYATVPFYWSDLEPQQGHLRFAKDSPPVHRRPPPDAVVEFCKRHHLAMRGHNLIWDKWYPSWLPNDQDEVTQLAAHRFESIAARYGRQIDTWDVVNEPLERIPEVILPKDYVAWSMNEAARLFPSTAKLGVNDVTQHWMNFRHEDSPFYLLLQNLLLRGTRLDYIGLQFHLFSEQLYNDVLAGEKLGPTELFRVLDLYAQLQRPIDITEITIPTLPCTASGEQDQAKAVRNFYRLWFSHPAVEAITWWNVADGTADARPGRDENHWCGGLVHRDFSPKPSFTALQNLIQHDWRTEGSKESGDDSAIRFQGFLGEYEIRASHAGKTVTRTIHLSRTGRKEFAIRFQ